MNIFTLSFVSVPASSHSGRGLTKGTANKDEIKTDIDMNKKKLIIGIVGVLVVAGGIWFFTGKTSKGGIRLETAKVGRSSISNTVNGNRNSRAGNGSRSRHAGVRYHRQVVCRL